MNRFTTDIVIGLEIHVELNTKSKLFCGCSNHLLSKEEAPNSRTCQICLGHPGSKPVVNKKAIEFGLRLALATHSEVAKDLIFSRKSYFYPDLSKNYQISQYEIPLAKDGHITLASGKKIALERIHIEEDPASLVHVGGGIHTASYVLVDYNRSGTPLVEIVTKPVLVSPEEAREFMGKLKVMLEYLEIFDPNGVIKADVNVSIKEGDYTRAEVKNVTGFKEIERAIEYEVRRQKHDISEGKKLLTETRSWDANVGMSRTLRVKESESDYGYIIDADLVKTEISDAWLNDVRAHLPELADAKAERFVRVYGLEKIDASVLTQDKLLAELFEKVAKRSPPLLAARWLRRELTRVMNYHNKTIRDIPFGEQELVALFNLIDKRMINETTAQRLMEKLMEGRFDIEAYVKKENLIMISDSSELENFCKAAIHQNPKAVEDFRSGNEKALNFLVGQVMRQTKGKATAQELGAMIQRLLGN